MFVVNPLGPWFSEIYNIILNATEKNSLTIHGPKVVKFQFNPKIRLTTSDHRFIVKGPPMFLRHRIKKILVKKGLTNKKFLLVRNRRLLVPINVVWLSKNSPEEENLWDSTMVKAAQTPNLEKVNSLYTTALMWATEE